MMTYTGVRKNESLGSSAARLRNEMKVAHGKYSDFIFELALLTKSELRPLVTKLDKKELNNGILRDIIKIFEKIENVLFDLGKIHKEMDEIIQVIGGLEFATSNTVDKLAEILNDQEKQHTRMITELTHLRNHIEEYETFEPGKIEEFKDDINEYQMAFSVFQDRMIEAVPRITNVFDELDREEAAGLKYGSTRQI